MAALRVREVPRRRRPPVDPHEVGRRGHGHRPDLQAGVPEGHALARARRARRARRRPARAPGGPRAPIASTSSWRRSSAARPRPRCGARTAIDPWFLRELRELALDPERPEEGVLTYRAVDTCAAEFEAETPYYYSAHERPGRAGEPAHEVARGDRASVIILGSGPNRIGQGIEFDYCCVHAAMTVRESGRDAVMVNCNPETVSTDYDTSDRLYFEPLTLEDVLAIVEVERPEGVIVQFGGQTPLKLAAGLEAAGVPLLGTSARGDRPRRGPRPLRRAARPARAARRRPTPPRTGAPRRWRPRPVSASRCSCARATCWAAARWSSSTTSSSSPTTSRARRRTAAARSSSTASWRTPSRSTWTRSATARTSGSAASCSTSRRRASTRATRPACCRRTRSAARCWARSGPPPGRSRWSSGWSGCSTCSSASWARTST